MTRMRGEALEQPSLTAQLCHMSDLWFSGSTGDTNTNQHAVKVKFSLIVLLHVSRPCETKVLPELHHIHGNSDTGELRISECLEHGSQRPLRVFWLNPIINVGALEHKRVEGLATRASSR